MAEDQIEPMLSAEWEYVTDEHLTTSFITQRTEVPGGWMYRSVQHGGQSIALCFVPIPPGEDEDLTIQEWESVINAEALPFITQRIGAPGGWVYRSMQSGGKAIALDFVPIPQAQPKG